MLKSYPTRYPTRKPNDTGVIRLTMDQEAVLQEQFNRWPRAPYNADVVLLAAETGLSEEDVAVSKHNLPLHIHMYVIYIYIYIYINKIFTMEVTK